MKKILTISLLYLSAYAQAQFVVGAQGMTIQAYATVCIDSLILSPGSDITLTNNQLIRSNTNQPVNSGNTMDRVYSFASPITYTGTIGFKYSDAELAGNTENSLELVYAATGTGSVWITTSGSGLNTASNTITNIVSGATISRVSATGASPLPVTLIEFTAKKDEKQQAALLHWDVTNEINFNSYNVERSIDGRVFTQIGMVKAEGKAAYDFTDNHPGNGINYYRLQMTSFDGSYSYSMVRTLTFGKNEVLLHIYPNPVRDETITIHTTDKTLDDKSGYVTDMAGKLILSFKLTGEKTTLDAHNWLPGTYLIRLENGMAFRIVKQ